MILSLPVHEFMAVYLRISTRSAKGFARFQKIKSLQVVDALGYSGGICFYMKADKE